MIAWVCGMSRLRAAYNIYENEGLWPLFTEVRGNIRKNVIEPNTVPLRLKLQYLWDRYQYGDAAPQPKRLLSIDPQRIEYVLFPPLHWDTEVTKYGTHLLAGDWDRCPVSDEPWPSVSALDVSDFDRRHRLRLDQYLLYKVLEEDVSSYQEYRERWQTHLSRFPKAQETKCGNAEYIRKYWELYNTVAESGYKSGCELGITVPYPEFNDVAVTIGRNGEIFSTGFNKNRIVIAQVLGLSSIPVRVNVRHTKWQEQRSRVLGDKSFDENDDVDFPLGHPDLTGIGSDCWSQNGSDAAGRDSGMSETP